MFLKKVLNQPNLVGTVMIALMVCSGFVYAFAFDGFNVETATGGEVEAWLAAAGGGGSGGDSCSCGYANCPGSGCSDCTSQQAPCKNTCGDNCNCPDVCTNITRFHCWALSESCQNP